MEGLTKDEKMKQLWDHVTHVLGMIIAVCMVCAIGACGAAKPQDEPSPSSSPTEVNKPITVVASLNQWGSFAKNLGGDNVEVTSLLNSTTADAHDFEPTAADVAKLEKADLVLVNGAGYDTWADKTLAPGAERISVAETVGALNGDNPHLWFSKDARNAVAKALIDAFIRLRPAEKATFNEQLKVWQAEEDKLEQTMKEFAKNHPDITYAATENIAYYLMSDLGFTDATPQGYARAAANESEPAAADINDFQQVLRDHDVSLLVNNAQESNKTTQELVQIAKAESIPVLDVTEQMPSDMDTLVNWIASLIQQIDQSVKGEHENDATGKAEQSGTNNGDTQPSPSADPAKTAQ